MRLAYRIQLPQLETDEQFTRLLGFLDRHRAAVDELALFTDYCHHGYTPPAVFAARAAIISQRIEVLKARGYRSVGINVLATLGHFPEANDFHDPLSLPPMVGHDGALSSCSPCPNTPAFREYIRERYATVARARPDFIWVDDDVRMEHHGEVAYGCFCPVCLERYARAFGHEVMEREALVAHLEAPDGHAWRKEWVEFNVQVIEDLLRDIARAVQGVNRRIVLGLMTIGPTMNSYSGQDIGRWMAALGGTRVRPGHGFYEDSAPRGMIAKALEVGRQCVEIPASVDTVQYELENFPYNVLDKSVRTVLNECALSLVMGCNGIAFNALKPLRGAFDDYEALLAAIQEERPVWEALLAVGEELPLVGVWPAAHPRLMARRDVSERTWFSRDPLYDIQRPVALAELGLPFTTDARWASVTLLSGRLAAAFTDAELRHFLSQGVLMDGETLHVLWERRLGALAGIEPGRAYTNGMREQLTWHPLNGQHAGEGRDPRMSILSTTVWELAPLNEDVEIASRLVSYDGEDRGPCVTLYENVLGGRVAVMGYVPWQRLGSSAKRAQVLALADWASRGRLPIRIDRTVRVTPFVRRHPDGHSFMAVLLNTGYDPTGLLEVRLRALPEQVQWLHRLGATPLSARREGGDTVVTIPSILPWQYAALVGK